MSRGPLLADVAIAVVAAAVILIITPGVAMAALIALIVLIVCLVSFVVQSRRGRVTPNPRRRVASNRAPRQPPRRHR